MHLTNTQVIASSEITISNLSADKFKITVINANHVVLKRIDGKPISGEICYRVLPLFLTKHDGNMSIKLYDSTIISNEKINFETPILEKKEELFDLGEINSGGFISRGLSMGNAQDVFVNSNMNLNLEGSLTEDLKIRAAITDQHIPYQPEGNTQQLQEFDNVFIELYNDNFSLKGGDVVLKDKGTHYLKYNRNSKGGYVRVGKDSSITYVGASSAKGKFLSKTLDVKEGVSGPYKIPPPSGESFVIVIANSEKVFLDGKLLSRGYNNDYTIDYNLGELSFTNRIMITQYSRVKIDFEYASRNYARSVISAGHRQKVNKLTIGVDVYSESDSKNKTTGELLSDDDKLLLSQVGDSLHYAATSGERLVAYDSNAVLYIKKDTTWQGIDYSIYQSTNVNSEEVYQVKFSDVGIGNGAYSFGKNTAFGRVYQWVGLNQGQYEPYIQLKAPNKKQMATLSFAYDANENITIYSELAVSEHNKNLFSALHSENNTGAALKTGITFNDITLGFLENYKLHAKADIEYVGSDFKAIDRFRRVEYDRDWSIMDSNAELRDLIISAGIGLKKNTFNEVSYKVEKRDKEELANGIQHWVTGRHELGKLQLNMNAFWMKNNAYYNVSEWQRIGVESFLKFDNVQPGFSYKENKNVVRDITNDSIISSANYFTEASIFIKNGKESKIQYMLSYSVREDKLPILGDLAEMSKSNNLLAKLGGSVSENHRLEIIFNYRKFEENYLKQNLNNTISSRIDWHGSMFNNALRHDLSYAVANAREPRREYVFIQVATGEGTHTWRDEDQDGVKDLSEFYLAINFDEKNYIKLYTPTSEYVDAFENIFNYKLNIAAPRAWHNSGGMKSILSRLSNTSTWTSQYRTTEDNLKVRMAPFLFDGKLDGLLSQKEAFRSTFFVNRASANFGMSGGMALVNRKILYANGFESRNDKEYNFNARWNFIGNYNLKLHSFKAIRVSGSNYLEGRSYLLNDSKIGPSIFWQPKPIFRITANYVFRKKITDETSEQYGLSEIDELSTEIKLGNASKFIISGLVKYSKIDFDGIENSALGYELLQGLRPGNNMSYTITWQQNIISGLRLNLYYEGRKPSSMAIIHSGRISVNAIF